MTYGITDSIFIICTAVLFVTILIAGMFSANAVSMWIKNRREERANRLQVAELRQGEWEERERNQWMALFQQKDDEVKALRMTNMRLEKNLEIASRLLEASEQKRLEVEHDD